MDKCDVCGNFMVDYVGLPNADILLILDKPDWQDVKGGYLMGGDVGDIFRIELARVGIQLNACRVVSLWRHDIPKKLTSCDLDYHANMLWTELKGKTKILLLGDKIIRAVTDSSLMDVSSLKIESELMPKGAVVVAAPNPSSLIRGQVGELRLALENFRRYINE
jgi:hypothetical protein